MFMPFAISELSVGQTFFLSKEENALAILYEGISDQTSDSGKPLFKVSALGMTCLYKNMIVFVKREEAGNTKLGKLSSHCASLSKSIREVFALHRLVQNSAGRYWLARIAAKLQADWEFAGTQRYLQSMKGWRDRAEV